VERNPQDAAALIELARAYLRTNPPFRARHYARQALEIDPHSQIAAWVLAQALLGENDRAGAAQALRDAFDPEHPFEPGLVLQARLAMAEKDTAEARRLCAVGAEHFPGSEAWPQLMSVVYREMGDKDKLAGVLSGLAAHDSDNLGMRMELAQMALDRSDYAAAARWAGEAIDIAVVNAEAHALLGRAETGLGRGDDAADEFEVAVRLKPDDGALAMELAEACVKAKRTERARAVLEELLHRDPENAEARGLLETLGG